MHGYSFVTARVFAQRVDESVEHSALIAGGKFYTRPFEPVATISNIGAGREQREGQAETGELDN